MSYQDVDVKQQVVGFGQRAGCAKHDILVGYLGITTDVGADIENSQSVKSHIFMPYYVLFCCITVLTLVRP